MVDLLEAQRHASNHRAEIEASAHCGCFNCMQIFPPSEITAWAGWDVAALEHPDTAEGSTAVCPHCGSESVIGDKSGFEINPQFLNRMNLAWYQRTIVVKPAKRR